MNTGSPTLQYAVVPVNKGANAYILQPREVGGVLAPMTSQSEKQKEEKKFSQNKVAEFIETRVKELGTSKEMTVGRKH